MLILLGKPTQRVVPDATPIGRVGKLDLRSEHCGLAFRKLRKSYPTRFSATSLPKYNRGNW
jgi:hypothetical protein